MKRVITLAILLGVIFTSLSCTTNIFEAFVEKDSDEAKYISAKMLMDDSNFDEAITLLLSTSATFQNKNEFKAVLASAYAGRGGLNFLSLIEAFDSASSTLLFPFLMQGFPGGSVARFGDLTLAEDSLNSISTDPASRGEDENILMILVSMAKIGNILSYYADADSNGALDGTFVDACVDNDNPGTAIDDGSVGELGLSMLTVLNVLPYISNNFTSNVLGGIDDCVDDIESLGAPFFPLAGVCAIDDPADFTALHIRGFRSLIKENSVIGLGVSCTGDIGACNCP